jgi:hypothetical protein
VKGAEKEESKKQASNNECEKNERNQATAS